MIFSEILLISPRKVYMSKLIPLLIVVSVFLFNTTCVVYGKIL